MTKKKFDISRSQFLQLATGLTAGLPLGRYTGSVPSERKKSEEGSGNKLSANKTLRIESPNKEVGIEFLLQKDSQGKFTPCYCVDFRDQTLLQPSRLGINLAGGISLGASSSVEAVTSRSFHNMYTATPGKRSKITNHYSEAVITLQEQTAPGYRWELILRAYNDGVAFRYRFPKQEKQDNLWIVSEQTTFGFEKNALCYALPLNSFTSNFEGLYKQKKVTKIPEDWLLGLPLLVECRGCGYAAITEANLTDYSGMYLACDQKRKNLVSRLAPLPANKEIAVDASLPHRSPWRTILIGDKPADLIESDMIFNLNEPCTLEDTSWIRTAKTTFPWWNGYYVEDASFEGGLNTATMKHYIDFCAENDISCHSLDGFKNVAWYGGPIRPYKGADITTALPDIDLPEVIRYGKGKGVKLRLWMHWKAAEKYMDRAFPLYRKWGIEGIMLDFMNRNDQEMVRFLHRVLEKAAENQLTVTLHGAPEPTGLERTYPHLLTSEGVRNLEYNKWDEAGCPPEHEVIVPFTRMLAGPLDFHQGSFRGVSVDEFEPRNIAPNIIGTPTRTLASYVIYQNHLSMVADYPAGYQNYPEGLSMLAKIPTTWDDTKVVSGSVGEYIVIARRYQLNWYMAAMNDRHARQLEISLNFLKSGHYRAKIYADDSSNPYEHISVQAEKVTESSTLKAALESAGGYMVWLSPLTE